MNYTAEPTLCVPLAAHVDKEDKKDALIQGPLGGTQKMTIINESGLYSLILSSKLEQAKAFKQCPDSGHCLRNP